MNSKKIKNLDKECPICGGIIWGRGVKVLIEGAKITVCQGCAQHGEKVNKPKQVQRIRAKYRKSSGPILPKNRKYDNEKIEIVDDYDIRLRTVRQKLNLNQDQFANKLNEKPSLIRRIESKKAIPTLKLARKIEKVYQIKLTKASETIDASPQLDEYIKKKSGSSLGDIAFIKKKK